VFQSWSWLDLSLNLDSVYNKFRFFPALLFLFLFLLIPLVFDSVSNTNIFSSFPVFLFLFLLLLVPLVFDSVSNIFPSFPVFLVLVLFLFLFLLFLVPLGLCLLFLRGPWEVRTHSVCTAALSSTDLVKPSIIFWKSKICSPFRCWNEFDPTYTCEYLTTSVAAWINSLSPCFRKRNKNKIFFKEIIVLVLGYSGSLAFNT